MAITSRFSWIAVALLGACVAGDGDRVEVDSFTAAIQAGEPAGAATLQQPDPDLTVAAREAVRLYEELATRLESRGYTTADAMAAFEARDEARARELFGYTNGDYEAIGARWTAIAEALEWDAVWSAEEPDGISCNWGKGLECAWGLGLGSLTLRGFNVSWPVVAAAIAGSVGLCAYNNCRWERSGSGPGTKPRRK
jgi:hypothetical protein